MAGLGMTDKLGWMGQFLRSQLLTSIPRSTADFAGQTVIITGSNTGLGREAARQVVGLGAAKVIIAVRTVSKGAAAAQEIVESCNVPKATIEVWQLDMSNPESIKSFAKRASSLERLDAALLNAGILTQKWESIDGVESQVAVNVIGALLLTCLLLHLLAQSAAHTGLRGRLSIVGSDLMYMADVRELQTDKTIMAKLNDPAQSQIEQRYQLSKVLVFYALRELAQRSPMNEQSDVLLSVMTPGACKSDIFRDEASLVSKLVMGLAMAAVARSTEVGGRTLVHSISPNLAPQAHGRFIMDNQIVSNGKNVVGPAGQGIAAKWNQELFAHLEKLSPGCTKF